MGHRIVHTAVGVAAGAFIAYRLGGSWPLAIAAGLVAARSPLASSILLTAYLLAAPILWRKAPGAPEALAAVLPAAISSGVVAAVAVTVATLLAFYALIIIDAITRPDAYPPPMRIVLEPLFTNPLLRILFYTISAAATLAALHRLSSTLAVAANPQLATRYVREYISKEAENMTKARAWHHRLLAWSLGTLASLPIAFIVNAFIYALYTALAVYAPNAWVRDALQVARGAITAFLLWSVSLTTSRSVERMLRGEWSPRPSPILAIAALAFALSLAVLAYGPLSPRTLACIILHCPPEEIPVTHLDQRLVEITSATWNALEATEDMLRFLTRLLWGS